ncbi:MarR family winged helix-turn-helix transcriptional regulator [Alteromonas sp. P256]|uniref:MarR family winged helix-turn-helix transcriptional regulator n=1 Tax=Alteromonas sp. P256 TaxID=3117399 RepID=UPI002FDFC05F
MVRMHVMLRSMKEEALTSVHHCACWRLKAAARKITRQYDEALKPVGLKATQFSLLSMIMGIEPNSFTRLADEIGMDRTALNRALNIMVKHDWVRISSSSDTLEKKIRITENGKSKLDEAIPLWRKAQKQFIESTGPESWEASRDWLINVAGGNTYDSV